MPAGRSRFKRNPIPSLSCIFLQKRKREPVYGLKEYQKNFTKKEFASKTIHKVAQILALRYDVSFPRIYALLGYTGAQALYNSNGKISGNHAYHFKVYEGMYERYKHYLTEQDNLFLEHIRKGSEFHNKVTELTNSVMVRGKIFANELEAYFNGYHRRSMNLSDSLLHFENTIKIPALALWFWSKPAFWLLMNMFVFDVSTAIAKEQKKRQEMYDLYKEMLPTIRINSGAEVLDFDALELGMGINTSWYERRPYLSNEAKAALYVYDNIVSEAAREIAAAGVSHLAQKYLLTNGLRLLAQTVFTVASYIPNVVGVGAKLATMINAIANFTEKSKIVWLLGQVGIEWQFEKWAAMLEHNILEKSLDFFHRYKPLYKILDENEIKDFFNLWHTFLKRKMGYLTPEESERFHAYLNRLGEHAGNSNIMKIIDAILKTFEYKLKVSEEQIKKESFQKSLENAMEWASKEAFSSYYFNEIAIQSAMQRGENIDIVDDRSSIFCNIGFPIKENAINYNCSFISKAKYNKTTSGNRDIITMENSNSGGFSYQVPYCVNTNYWGHILCNERYVLRKSKTTIIDKSSNFPLEAFINMFKSNYYISPIRMIKTAEYHTSGNVENYTDTYTQGDLEYNYNINLESERYETRDNNLSGLNEFGEWTMYFDYGDMANYYDFQSYWGEIVIRVPYTPTVLMLPVIYKKDFEKVSFNRLINGKTYKCYGFKYVQSRYFYVPIVKDNYDFFFNQSGNGIYSISEADVDYYSACEVEEGEKDKCIMRREYYSYMISKRQTKINCYHDYKITVSSGYGWVSFLIQQNLYNRVPNYIIFSDGAEFEFDFYRIGRTFEKRFLIGDKRDLQGTGLRYTIYIDRSKRRDKIVYLEPIDLTQKPRKRTKIICFPYNPLARGG